MESDKPGSSKLKYAARIRLPVANEDEMLASFGQDLRDGGIFIRHDRPPSVDSLVQIEFVPGEEVTPISRVIGRVEHSRPATMPGEATAGMQLRFVELDDVARRVADKFAATHGAATSLVDGGKFNSFNLGKSEQAGLLSLSGPIIGIDLGTVNTCVAMVQDGAPKVFRTSDGYETVPSVVFIGQDKQVVVGQKALEKMILEPSRGIHGSKRFLGRPFASKEVRSRGHFFNYGLVEGQNGRTAAKVGDTTIPLEEVSAHILRAAKDMAAKTLGRDVARAVVTVPAYFGETQRQAVREAGKLAGLFVERIINEPTAAAVAYGFGRALQRTILVYDLGGGTFDASILRINGDALEVLATDGDPFLGGQDFDDRMTEYVLMTFERTNGINLRTDPVAVQRLRYAVQQAKHHLSEAETAKLNVPYVAKGDAGQIDLHMTLERKLLESLTQDLVTRTLTIVDAALKAANITSAQLDDVLLVGGQSRSPAVRRSLVERFGRKPSNAVHPDQAVAQGAAIIAEALQKKTPVHLTDVLPGSIRLAVAEGKTLVLLARGTRLPATKQFEVTAPEKAQEFKVILCRGEEPMYQQNTLLGMLRLANAKSPIPGGKHKAHVTIQVSAEGILTASVRNPDTGAHEDLEMSLTDR